MGKSYANIRFQKNYILLIGYNLFDGIFTKI